jgi:D-alanine--poly(phosphoribitol) ligase subunit 1
VLNHIINTARSLESRTAVISGSDSYTYSDLLQRAAEISETLQGIEDEFIGLYTDNNFYTYASILGVLFSGKAFVPLNHKFPKSRLNKIVQSTELNFCLACEESTEKVNNLNLEVIVSDQKIKPKDLSDFSVDMNSQSIAYILFTSGSTGEPKGIPISIENLHCLSKNMADFFATSIEDKVLQMFELSFDVSIANTFMAFDAGATLVLSPLNNIVAIDAAKTIYDNKVNIVTMPPSAINYLKKYKILDSVDFTYVTKTVFTGEALPLNYLTYWKNAAPNSKLYNAYGPTENTVWSAWCELGEEDLAKSVNGLLPIGKVLDGFDYRLMDESGDVSETKGELWVSGAQVMNSYWKNEAQTSKALEVADSKIWYKSGDIVEMLDTGNLMYLNRKDFQVQVNGYRVELSEVEHKIKTVLGVDMAVVIPISENDEPLWLLAVAEKNEISKDEVARLRLEIPFYMFPKKLEVMASFPLNSNGKIDKKKIKELLN